MGNLSRIPFTEMYERVKRELVRDDSVNTTAEDQYKGRINDIYMYDLPQRIDWPYIVASATITTTDDYSTGTITSISTTTVTGSSTAWTSANSNGMLFKHDDYDEVYRATYSAATSLTLDRSWVEGTVTAGGSYLLLQDRYALASDFDRMAYDPQKSVYYWSDGVRIYLEYVTPDQWDEKFTTVVGDPQYFTIKWSGTTAYLHITPCTDSSMTIGYDYIPQLTAMTEYTTGTASCTNGATAVTGASTAWTGYVTSTETFYFSFDGDGVASSRVWYAVSTAGGATSITLSSAYGGATKSAQSYTISKISKFAPILDLAIVYKAAAVSSGTQNNQAQIQVWNQLYEQLVNQYASRQNSLPGNQRVRTVYEDAGVRR